VEQEKKVKLPKDTFSYISWKPSKQKGIAFKITSYLRVCRLFTFSDVFTVFISLNKLSRALLLKNYAVICPERQVFIDLGETTKLIKKMPKFIKTRLNCVKTRLRADSRLDRVQRFVSFFKPLRGTARLLLELNGLDDSEPTHLSNVRLFEESPVWSLGLNKCNL